MPTTRNHVLLRVGILVSAALALLAFAILAIGRGTRFFTGSATLEAHFERINGLQNGAPVLLAGVNVGAVESIRFPTDATANYIIVTMWVERGGAARIRSDSVAGIGTMGLLGDKYVEITPGCLTCPPLAPGQALRTENPIDYESILRGFKGSGDLMTNVIALSASLRQLAQATQTGSGLMHELFFGAPQTTLTLTSIRQAVDHVAASASELQEVVAKLNRGKGLAGAMLSNQINGQRTVADLTDSIRSLRRASHNLDEITAEYQHANGTIPQLMLDRAYAREVMGNLDQSSRNLREILEKINSTQGTLGLLVNDPTLYKQASAALSGGGFSILGSILQLFQSHSSQPLKSSPNAVAGDPAR